MAAFGGNGSRDLEQGISGIVSQQQTRESREDAAPTDKELVDAAPKGVGDETSADPAEEIITPESIQAHYHRRTRPIMAMLGLAALLALTVVWFVDPRESSVSVCGLKQLTGLDCPGCGGTRATHLILHGQFREAARYNIFWTLTWPLWLYVTASIVVDLTTGRLLPGKLHTRAWFWVWMMTALLLFGIVRNLPWYPSMG